MHAELPNPNDHYRRPGRLIINADDWGRDPSTTDCALDCIVREAASSVSAMVFMKDSERAAEIAHEHHIDVGLHLNFTTPFSATIISPQLSEHQQRIGGRLQRHRFSQGLFHPGLMQSFNYVVSAQIDEFERLYGSRPNRIDGHHHMHLCANVILGTLLPRDTIVRRNFSLEPSEKNFLNRTYRWTVDRILARRHRLTDFFFSLSPLEPPARVKRIFDLARRFVVEVETHPINLEERRFLAGGEIFRWLGNRSISRGFIFV
jgi:chitin disaccharide deacetylase